MARGMLAFWLGGAAAGEAAEPVVTPVAGGEYGDIRQRGKGRKRRYFVEIDGRKIYGRPEMLARILDARTSPPLVQRPAAKPAQVVAPAPPQAVQVAAPIPLPDLRPVDLSNIISAQRLEEARVLKLKQRNAAIALLLLT